MVSLTSALGEFNIDIDGQRVKGRIESEGAVLDGTEAAAGRLFGADPDAFRQVAEGIGTLARKALGVEVEVTSPDAFNGASDPAASTQDVIHDPATLIASTMKVTRVGAGGGLEDRGPIDQAYDPNYEGPAWTTGSLTGSSPKNN